MKNLFCCLIIFVLISPSVVIGQKSEIIRLKTGDLIVQRNLEPGSFHKQDISNAIYQGEYYLLISFDKNPSAEAKSKLLDKGIALEQFINGTSWMARVKSSVDFMQLRNLGIMSVMTFPGTHKLSAELLDQNLRNSTSLIALNYFASLSLQQVEIALAEKGIKLVQNKFTQPGLVFINADVEQLKMIAAQPWVIYVARQVVEDKPVNYNNNGAHSNTTLSNSRPGGRALTGRGVTIGVGDNGDVSTHLDFTGRLINRNGYLPGDHGTHTTGTAAGGGLIDSKHKGMAPKARIVSQLYSDIIVNTPALYHRL